MKPKVNYGLWVTIMCQRRFILGKNCRGWGPGRPLVSFVCPQLAVAVQMFQSMVVLGTAAAGSGGGRGAGPAAAVTQGSAGTAVGTVAPGGPAGCTRPLPHDMP